MEEKKKTALDPEDVLHFDTQREEFVETFFRKGAEFASALIQELENLRARDAKLSAENMELKHQLASDDAIRELLKKIEQLEHEKRRLQGHASKAVEETENYEARYAEVEKELDTMANLYVALYQLHATLQPKEVLGVIEQMLAQFVGVGSFVIYLTSEREGKKGLEPVHAYHYKEARDTRIPWYDGPIGEAAASQRHFVAEPDERVEGEPIACIPMVLGSQTVGVIAIMRLFEQKDRFVDIDFEFFKLLAIHSASAIVGSGLMARAGSISASLESYERL